MNDSKVHAKAESPWLDRLRALRNMPPVLRILWESGPSVVSWGVGLRVIVAVLPFAVAKVAQYIVTDIAGVLRGQPLAPRFWTLVATEVALNVFLGLVTRAIDYSDSLLSNRYTQYASVKVMEQAARLDLTTYENPIFYDRLERARVQATDRLAMIQQMGRLMQQVITTLTFSIALAWASPWLVLLLALGVLPSFVGETHYAFLGYAKNFRQTPAKRQMDYLRQVAGSREGAKEVKLFGLNEFFTERFQVLANQIYVEDIALSRSKLIRRRTARRHWNARLLRRLCLRHLADSARRIRHRQVHVSHRRHSAGQLEPAAGVFYRVRHRRSGAVPHRSDRVLRNGADDAVEA